MEKSTLEALKKPPSISNSHPFNDSAMTSIDEEMLSKQDVEILQSLRSSTELPINLTSRVNKVVSNLGPSIDMFADGVHKINQYRTRADEVASQVLSICADRLAVREKEGRRKALGLEEDRSPGRDLSSVLRGLSKSDRQ